MLWVYVVFVAFSWGETFFVAAAFLPVVPHKAVAEVSE